MRLVVALATGLWLTHALDVCGRRAPGAVGDDDVVEGRFLAPPQVKADLDHCGFSVLPSGRNGRVNRQL